MNACQFGGRIVSDIVIRDVGAKKVPVANFTIAINRSYKKQDGTWEQKSAFARCVIWDAAAVNLHKNYKKGDAIYVESSFESEPFTDKEGNKRTDNRFRVTNFYRPIGFKKTVEAPTQEVVPQENVSEKDIPF